ncbi:hypothetical protein ACIRH0_12995 [Streptomyces sp. NPDC093675]|uniref:hypothetical protein n=1 Tax=Streptomyces sp. NPDC093675 TaxID=3366049 RepID=UPI0037FD4487
MIERQANERVNEIVLLAVQALLGLISEVVIAVGVRVEEDHVTLVFWSRQKTSDLESDAEEATFELDALFSEDHPLISYRIEVGDPGSKAMESVDRMIYWAK